MASTTRDRGFTLPQLLVVAAMFAIVAGTALATGSRVVEAFSLQRSADLATGHLARARLAAVARREVVRIRAGPDGALLLLDAEGGTLAVTHVGGGILLRLDSMRVRPSTLRFNARGQAAPGSIYLYRGKRVVRLVSNFLGRVRRESSSLP